MAEKYTIYDPANDLVNEEAIAFFMEDAFRTNDDGYIAHAREVVKRAKAMWPNQ